VIPNLVFETDPNTFILAGVPKTITEYVKIIIISNKTFEELRK